MQFYEKAHQKVNETGKSTLEIGYEKQQIALAWVYRFGWSSAIVLDRLAQKNRRGYSNKLVEKKLLQETENEAGWGVKNAPKKFLTLTKLGVEEIEKDLEEEQMVGYPMDGRNLIRLQNAKHDLFVQKYLLNKIEKFGIDLIDFKTIRELSTKSEAGIKEPDIVILHNKRTIAIEIELTIKKGRELDQFCNSIIKSLISNKYYQTHIISDSNGIINKYSKILHDINARVPIWRMKENRTWYKTDKVITSNSSIAERIEFYKLSDDGTTTLAKKYEGNSTSIIIEDDDDDEFDIMSLARN
jgi:hypothetical protein